MMVVAGFNTAIDIQLDVAVLRPGDVQRSSAPQRMPGGKGLHVAQTIAALGEPVTLIGLVDAGNRTRIAELLDERGVRFIGVDADHVRECWAIREADGRMTEVLQPGPSLGPEQVQALRDAFTTAISTASLVVLSGSLPPGCPPATYAELIEQARAAGIDCLLDTSGQALQRGVQARPYSVKPNRDEITTLFGPVADQSAAVQALRHLHAAGIAVPLLSLGKDGALAMDNTGLWHARVDVPTPVNPVGSGDCMLAGLAVAMQRKLPTAQALQLAVACGGANAALPETGYVPPGVAEQWLPKVQIHALPV